MKYIIALFCISLIIFSGCSAEGTINNKLIGTWKLQESRYADGSVVSDPENGKPILFVFEDNSITGVSGYNTIEGNYEHTSNEITFLTIGTTELIETDWERLLSIAFSEVCAPRGPCVFEYEVSSSTLTLFYENDGDNLLVFKRE
ncbi:Heat shock protein HslJ [Flavobacteriaceae bacterium MAR_2010_188]|nr:Heat shock protein HslJ [Flavobacteriaceae bacterium MAR_2010_188]